MEMQKYGKIFVPPSSSEWGLARRDLYFVKIFAFILKFITEYSHGTAGSKIKAALQCCALLAQ